MKLDQQPILLIGFKHVGKSVIGSSLAEALHRPFIDLDQRVEALYEDLKGQKLTCREILQINGESFFRELEKQALEQAIQAKHAIISLGGGTILNPESLACLKGHCVIHIQAPRGIVFERIMASGRPSFFSPDSNPYESFIHLWEAREQIYQRCQSFSIMNQGSVEEAVQQIIQKMEGPL